MTQLGSPRTVPWQITTTDSPFAGGQTRFGVGFWDLAPTTNNSVIGYQDDVRVYHGALSLAELEAVRQEGLVPEPNAWALIVVGLCAVGAIRRK